MNIKNEVLVRMYVVLFGMIVPFAVVLCYKTVQVAVIEGDKWRKEGRKRYVDLRTLEAERGNILTEDGSLLATSLPFFDIAFDPNSSGMKPEDFEQNVDSLGYLLATRVDNTYTPGGYTNFLREKRASGAEYIRIKKGATFQQMQEISRYPLFQLGQYR
ncbi:MAG: peptidoglycan glycosyltransferase, partial [Saprospiraceae bacterium]